MLGIVIGWQDDCISVLPGEAGHPCDLEDLLKIETLREAHLNSSVERSRGLRST